MVLEGGGQGKIEVDVVHLGIEMLLVSGSDSEDPARSAAALIVKLGRKRAAGDACACAVTGRTFAVAITLHSTSLGRHLEIHITFPPESVRLTPST